MNDIKEYTLEELAHAATEGEFPRYCAQQIFRWVYKKRVEDFSLMSDLSKSARTFFADNFCFSYLKKRKRAVSADGTEKFLFALSDGALIETVHIPEAKRNTLCVSTQVGCKYRCAFCVSGWYGLVRNLTASEIINQYLAVSDCIRPLTLSNIVFMGIGEPLDNVQNLIRAICILKEPAGCNLSRRKLCISTAGVTPAIDELCKNGIDVRLSISLHAAEDALRSKIMPINKKYPLQALIKAAKRYARATGYPVTLEYILIKDCNSSRSDAARLARLAKGYWCKLNIIPYNPSRFFKWQPPSSEDIMEFTEELKNRNIFFTLRKGRGSDIDAACGQLRARSKKR